MIQSSLDEANVIQRSLTRDLCKWHTKHTLPQYQKVFCTQFRFQCSLRTPGHNYIKTKDTPPTPIVLTLDLGVHWPVPAPHPTFASSQAIAVLGRGQTCRQLRPPSPLEPPGEKRMARQARKQKDLTARKIMSNHADIMVKEDIQR